MKITIPITTLPPTTKLPKDAITAPALACIRIRRVDATFKASRKSVVKSKRDGKAEISNACFTCNVTKSIKNDNEILTVIKISSKNVGSGTIRTTIILNTPIARPNSLCLNINEDIIEDLGTSTLFTAILLHPHIDCLFSNDIT